MAPPLEQMARDLIAQMQEVLDNPNEPYDAQGLAYHIQESLQNALDEMGEE